MIGFGSNKNHPLHPKSPRRICTTPSRGRQRTWVPAWPLSSAPSPPSTAPRATLSAPDHPLKLWVRQRAAAASRLQFLPTILTVNLPSQVRRWLREDVKTHECEYRRQAPGPSQQWSRGPGVFGNPLFRLPRPTAWPSRRSNKKQSCSFWFRT